MSSHTRPAQNGAGTTDAQDLLSDADTDWTFSQPGQRYEWTHEHTGLQVIISPKAGLRDGYGGVSKGFEVVARDESGQVVDDIHSIHGGTVVSKSDAKRMAREWMLDRPDGELLGTEEVDF